jgi:hypothetical protein
MVVQRRIKQNTMHCLTGLLLYDWRYSLSRDCVLKPLFPALLLVFWDMFWEEVIVYMADEEESSLEVSKMYKVTNDVRGGCLFLYHV